MEDLCLQGRGASLHKRLSTECANFVTRRLENLERDIGNCGGSSDAVLQLVDRAWREHCDTTTCVRNICLDRSTACPRGLWDLGLDLFRDQLTNRPHILIHTVVGLLASVEAQR